MAKALAGTCPLRQDSSLSYDDPLRKLVCVERCADEIEAAFASGTSEVDYVLSPNDPDTECGEPIESADMSIHVGEGTERYISIANMCLRHSAVVTIDTFVFNCPRE